MNYRHSKVPAKPLNSTQILAVLNAFEGMHKVRNKTLFFLLITTGYRISEILSLRIENVFQFGKVADDVSVERIKMKEKRSRTVKLTAEARACILEYLQECGRVDGRLFEITRYQADKLLRATFHRAEVEYRGTHYGRKTFAVNMYGALENDIFALSKLMGHSSIVITQTYLSTHQEKLDKAVLSASYLAR